MRLLKAAIVLMAIVMIGVLVWYFSFPAYEQKAEDRVDTYMEVQVLDKGKANQILSAKNKQGRWEIRYSVHYEENPSANITYEYTYDRARDGVLLTIKDGGLPLELASEYRDYSWVIPELNDGEWTYFDRKGNPVLKE